MKALGWSSACVIDTHGIACVHVFVPSTPAGAIHATFASVPHEPSVKHAPGTAVEPHSTCVAHPRQLSVARSHTGDAPAHAVESPALHCTHWCFVRSQIGSSVAAQSRRPGC